jgi:NADH dehydrogenase
VLVEPDLTVPGHSAVYVTGDLAAYTHQGGSGKSLPGVAPVAIQTGQHAAEDIWRVIRGQPRRRFTYFDRGTMATIGRAAGVAQFREVHLSGLVAWLAWLFVHVLFLIGFENRILVLAQWMESYFTYQRSARLITQTALSARWTAQLSTATAETTAQTRPDTSDRSRPAANAPVPSAGTQP